MPIDIICELMDEKLDAMAALQNDLDVLTALYKRYSLAHWFVTVGWKNYARSQCC